MTLQEAIITITLDDSGEERRLAFSEVRRIIGEHLNAANFVMAASVSTQLADQRPQDLWPQFVAAESLFLHQEIETAFQYIDRALEIHPGHLACLVLKSRLYGYDGDSIFRQGAHWRCGC